MPVTGYTSQYFQVTGSESVSLADLPKRGSDYFWDFRGAILTSLMSVPAPPGTVAATQILGYITVNTPVLTVRASAYQGAGSPAKRGSWSWISQGSIYEGGFLNFASQWLGNFSTLDLNDTIADLDGLIQYAVPAVPGVAAKIADSMLVNLSGASDSEANIEMNWWVTRQTYSGTLSNILITRTGQV